MNEPKVQHLHEYSFEEFRNLLHSCLDDTIPDLEVYPNIVGGWTSVNLRASSNNLSLIIKIPAEKKAFEKNPFEYAFSIATDLYKLHLSPQPMVIGRLSDNIETPFAIYEYVAGRRYSDLSQLNSNELDSLIDLKTKLNAVKPDRIHSFGSTSEYLDYLIARQKAEWLQLKPKSMLLEKSLQMLMQETADSESIYSLEEWPDEFMHGDFHLENIVFSNQNPILLDFEEAALGNPLYDYAYLTMESYNPEMYDRVLKGKIPNLESIQYRHLCKAALIAIIAWTYNRLIRIEYNIVDPILSDENMVKMMRSYLASKIELLAVMKEI